VARRTGTVVLIVLVLLVAGSVSGLLPLQIKRVSTGSMTPTIAPGDLLMVQRWGAASRRDVVAVPDPTTGELLVKRVVGVGGDHVAIEDGVLVVDGARACEPQVDPTRLDGVWMGPITVPPGRLFLLGDNREVSVDSRAFGTVAAADVVGTVHTRVWPSPGPLPTEHC